jgi:lactoylglutathione lyase
MFQTPMMTLFTQDVPRLVNFYERLGFRETFRTPKQGTPAHVEVALDQFTIGISSVDAAINDHGLKVNLGGRPAGVALWTEDVDRDYARLTAEGALSLSPPHDFLSLRAAWVADPDGNPVNIIERRGKMDDM